MRKILVIVSLACSSFLSWGQEPELIESVTIHNSCVTAAKVCGYQRLTVTLSYKDCPDSLIPQYFKFDMVSSGIIQLNTFSHTGTYTLYGPMDNSGISACQQILIGQIGQVSGALSTSVNIPHLEGKYVLVISPTNCVGVGDIRKMDIEIRSDASRCDEIPDCRDCISSFSPDPGKYLISAWVKGEAVNKNASYVNPEIRVSFVGAPDSLTFIPQGLVIDEWQRIDGELTVPTGATRIRLWLVCNSGNCLFDDIRFVPMDGSMISYVYDPVSLKLIAQLDERNYATFYEYDEQGKLIRTKKETERGIMTIQENRDNIYNK